MTRDAHLDDHALLRLADGADAGAAARHLERCPECRARLDGLTRASDRFADLLELATPLEPVPEYDAAFLRRLPGNSAGSADRKSVRKRGWILLLAAGLAALLISVSPAGAWLARHLSPLFGGAGTRAASSLPAPAVASEESPGESEVSARTSAAVFVVHLAGDALPSGVRIRVAAAGAEPGLVSARLMPGGAVGSVLVEPDAFRIRATARDTLDVTVPPTVRRVRVFIDERVVAEPDAEELRATGAWLDFTGGA